MSYKEVRREKDMTWEDGNGNWRQEESKMGESRRKIRKKKGNC